MGQAGVSRWPFSPVSARCDYSKEGRVSLRIRQEKMESQIKTLTPCFHYQKPFHLDSLISGELIRPAVAEVIKKRDSGWTPSSLLSPDCLNLFRSEYVEEVKDRLRSENEYQVNLKAELEIRHLHEKLDMLLNHQWQKLLEIQ